MDPLLKKLKTCNDKSDNEDSNDSDGNVSESLSITHNLHSVPTLPETLTNDLRNLAVARRRRQAEECVDWQDACEHPSLWGHVEFKLRPDRPIPFSVLKRRQIRKFFVDASHSPILLSSHLKALFDRVPKVQSLRCSGCDQLTDDNFRDALPSMVLPRMTHLDMSDTNLTDDSIDLITRLMPNLVFLKLSLWRSVTDKALLVIATRLRKLEILDLDDCPKFTEKGFGYLAGKINAKDAEILQNNAYDSAGDLDVANLAGQVSSIVTLNICSEQLTNNFLRDLSHMANLKQLSLSYCDTVNDAGLAYLSKVANLQELDLIGCDCVTDVGLLHVGKMPGLHALTLSQCHHLTMAGLQFLGLQGSRITSLSVSNCRGFLLDVLYEIAVWLPHLRFLQIDCIKTTFEGFKMAANYLRNLEVFSVCGLDNLAGLVALRR